VQEVRLVPGLLKQVVALLQSERWLGLELRAVLQLQVRVVVELHLRLEARPDVQARAVLRQTQGRQQVGTTCNEVVLCRWTDSLLVRAASERQCAVVAPTCATAVRTHAHIDRSYVLAEESVRDALQRRGDRNTCADALQRINENCGDN
jgi:hypothetical protein